MRKIIIVAGPNGAGKTSFANEFLAAEKDELAYVNADEIARTIVDPQLSQTRVDFIAARRMLAEIERLVAAGASFMFETTLASLTYATRIPKWREQGFSIALVYLRLASPEVAIQRVKKRAAAGGHNIAEQVIRQRFGKSFAYLETRYKPVVDEWYVWDSLEGEFQLAEAWDR